MEGGTVKMGAADILSYGALCQRVGAMQALAAYHKHKGRKKEAARLWRAFYDTNKEKEACLKRLLKGLGFDTPMARGR